MIIPVASGYFAIGLCLACVLAAENGSVISDPEVGSSDQDTSQGAST